MASVVERELRRLRSVQQGRLASGPETLQVNLGHACNLNCIFCWNHSPLQPRHSKAWHGQHLSEEHARNIAEALPRLRPDRMMLSGQGEPLIQPAAETLIKAARDADVPILAQTNGVGGLPVKRLVGVQRLMVNLSAATTAGYEATHPGRSNLLSNVRTRLGEVAALRANGGGPAVTLMAVIQQTNVDELLPLVEFAADVGASSVHFKGMEFVPGLESLVLDEEARKQVADNLALAQIRGRAVGVSVKGSHLEQVLRSKSSHSFTHQLRDIPCLMGWYYLRVTCDGRVMFCCKDKQVGHLDQASLYRIWRSPTYQLHRLAAKAMDASTGLLDRKCQACSNFERNLEVVRALDQAASR